MQTQNAPKAVGAFGQPFANCSHASQRTLLFGAGFSLLEAAVLGGFCNHRSLAPARFSRENCVLRRLLQREP